MITFYPATASVVVIECITVFESSTSLFHVVHCKECHPGLYCDAAYQCECINRRVVHRAARVI